MTEDCYWSGRDQRSCSTAYMDALQLKILSKTAVDVATTVGRVAYTSNVDAWEAGTRLPDI